MSVKHSPGTLGQQDGSAPIGRACSAAAGSDFSTPELRPPSYFTLAALIDGPLHGYAIMRRASELSDGTVRVSTGTLYSILERALAEGLVVAGDPYVVSGRERRDYQLTPAGRLVLADEAARLARAASVVGARLKATGAFAT
jgi:PadR family transcriptional regulator PadR